MAHEGDRGIDNPTEKVWSGSHDVVALESVWTDMRFMKGDTFTLF